MLTLADQILERFPGSGVVDRASLAIGGNYDSVGRALGQLVRQRKLVRVGRGQYKKVCGRATLSAGSIAEIIERKVARSKRNVFLRKDFADLGSYDAVGRALRQMTQSGRLVQIGYGLYAKAMMSPFSGKPAPLVGIKRLATEALERLGKSIAESSAERAYNSGHSTQVPTGRKLLVNGRVRRRIGYDGNFVVLERA